MSSDFVLLSEVGQIDISADEAFSKFVFEARSLDTQRSVYLRFRDRLYGTEASTNDSNEHDFLHDFIPALEVKLTGISGESVFIEPSLRIGFSCTNSSLCAEVANALAEEARMRARASVVSDVNAKVSTRIQVLESRLEQKAHILKVSDQDIIVQLQEADALRKLEIEDQIAALKQKARQLREDRIAEIKEALRIAESLDIPEPTTLQILAKQHAPSASVSVSADLSYATEPLYLRGTRLLQAELKALQSRTSDLYTTPEVRDLQAELYLLERNRRIQMLEARDNYTALAEGKGALRSEIAELRAYLDKDFSQVDMARVDQIAVAGTNAIKPRKGLLLALALVGGTFFGLAIALVMIAVENRRQPPPAADTAQ
tara:strand:+ start:13285 stop:14403 length:1119 start_codon:yes stop_codon:yes gene_type:complete